MRLYDSLSAQKVEVAPSGGEVKLYVCGITPYAPCHLGHALSYVVFDVLRRFLEFRGYRVRHVQNFTDIDDKIIARAREEGVPPQEVAERYMEEYFRHSDVLHIQRAHVYPRATQHIPQMLDIIRSLVDRGYAYEARGNVYFRVRRFPGYGKLSHRDLEAVQAGARVEPGEEKEDPLDFALWKAAKPGEPWWDSPWGPGRPGWHIECTAMSLHYLGAPLDIHGGGQDLVFPHHENEIAQSEAYLGQGPFARLWVHNGLLQMGEDKMSKSLGNVVPWGEALAVFSPDALRLFFLSSHYRSPLTFNEEAVRAQERAVERLRQAAWGPEGPASAEEVDPDPYRERFIGAMEDDLNTPRALASLFDLAREINRGQEGGKRVGRARRILRELAGVLGLTLQEAPRRETDLAPFIDLLVEVRHQLRTARNFALADRIRQRLADLGVALEDTPQGTRWKFTNR